MENCNIDLSEKDIKEYKLSSEISSKLISEG